MATAKGEVDLATRLARTKDHSIRNVKAHLKTQEKRKLCKRRIRQFALPMDAIVRAVETKIQGRRRAKPVPKWLNRRRLRLDTDHAISTYEIFRSVDRTQPWNARRKHAEESIALLDKFASFAFGREPRTGRLLRRSSGVAKYLDARYPKHEREKLFGQLRSAIREINSQAAEITSEPVAGPGYRKITAETESSLQWLIGERLAQIFERWFRKGTANQPDSPYIGFVLAVLDYANIHNDQSPISAETVFTYRKRAIRKAKKMKPRDKEEEK